MSYGNGIKLTAGFDVGAKTPLDSKSVVQTIDERNAFVTNNLAYEGLEVYVVETKKKYRYNGTGWIDIDSNTGGTGLTEEQATNLTDAYIHSQSNHAPVNAEENVQSDWNETDETSDAFIKNKPTFPTKTSQLTNDSGFLTDIPSEYVTDTELGAKDYATETYLDDVLDGHSFKFLTQAEYNNITPEPNVVYYITDASDSSTFVTMDAVNEAISDALGTALDSHTFKFLTQKQYDDMVNAGTIDDDVVYYITDASETSAFITMTDVNEAIGTALDGHTFKFLTQAEYDLLTDEEKNNPLIIYYITDKSDEGLTVDTSNFYNKTEIDTKISKLNNNIMSLESGLTKINYASSVEITAIRNYIDVTGDITITLPDFSDRYTDNPFTYEYHIYMNFTNTHTVNFTDTIKWQSIPTINAGTIIDFIFNFIHVDSNTNFWLGGAVVYE